MAANPHYRRRLNSRPQPRPRVADPSEASPLQIQVRDSFHTAPGYREVSVRYSAIHDPELPPDPTALIALREFFPEGVYLRKLWTFRSPSGDSSERNITFVRHCLGSYVWNPHSPKPPFYVEMPADSTAPPPNQLDLELMYPNQDRSHSDLPGPYMPFNLETVNNYIRPLYDISSTKDRIRRFVTLVLQRRAEQAQAQAAEFDAILAESAAHFERRLAQLSDVEISEHLRQQAADKKKRHEELYLRLQKAAEKHPQVYVHNPNTRKDQ